MTESIESQFARWVAERDLDANAKAQGMERIVKRIGRTGSEFHDKAFVGRLLVGTPELDGLEVYVTRRGQLALFSENGRGRTWLDLYESKEEMAQKLGPERRHVAHAVFAALEKEVQDLDW